MIPSSIRDDLTAFGALLKRDLLLTLSYRTKFVTTFASAIFSLTIFHFISRLVRISTFPTHDAYFAYVVIGLITLQILNSTLAAPPGSFRQELVAGTFERLLVSPFGAVRCMLGMLLFPFLLTLAIGLAMLAFAGLVFGVPVEWYLVPLVVPTAGLAALSFAPFGILFVGTVLLVKQAAAGSTFVVAGISLLAGLYFPVALLPGWVRWISSVLPFTPAVDVLRHLMTGAPSQGSTVLMLVKLVAFGAVLLPLSVLALVGALRISRARGTLLEY